MEEMNVARFTEIVERMSVAAAALEEAAKRLGEQQAVFAASAEETVERIVATVDHEIESVRETELKRKLADAEQTIAQLRASAGVGGGRKTMMAHAMVAKGSAEGGVTNLSAVDAALAGLSLEQRIAVKAGMLRSGLL